MLDKTEISTGCKINLCLKITGLRADGYHTLSSYLVPLPQPADLMLITTSYSGSTDEAKCSIKCSSPGIDLKNNTLTKAFKLFTQESGHKFNLNIELIKYVPQGAGLGGGSANAAGLLKYLNALLKKHAQHSLTKEHLISIAAKVGADVPFFLLNRPAWISGIGEIIRPDELSLAPYKNIWLVLLCPPLNVPTQWAFKEWDKFNNKKLNNLTSQEQQDTNYPADAVSFKNSLEFPVFAAYPEVKLLKTKLLKLGAEKAVMSGSGSSVIGLFSTQNMAQVASKDFKANGLSVYTQVLYAGASPSR